MPRIEWKDEYSINIRDLDEDHKKLIALINEFDEAVSGDTIEKILGRILDNLFDFCDMHFSKEEELMKQHKYPDYDEHKFQHNAIIEDLFKLYKGHMNGEKEIATQTAFLLGSWLLNHKDKEDKKLGEFLNGKGLA